jgi:hypothetical protein
MGFGDKFKHLADQAKEAVAEHKDQIHDAVDAVSVAVDKKTHGRHTANIMKFNQKASGAVDKVADQAGAAQGNAAAPEGDTSGSRNESAAGASHPTPDPPPSDA